jgi:hypothetical protein
MRCRTGLMSILLVLAMTGVGFAGSAIPDLKGTWVVKASGSGFVKPSESPPHTGKLGFHEAEFLMIIDKQDGFRFSGSRESSRKKETVAGVIGYDLKNVYMVDDDGMIMGKLVSPDKMECIYLHVSKYHSIASREIMTRKR